MNTTLVLRHILPRQKTSGVQVNPQFILSAVGFIKTASVFVLVLNFFAQGLLNNILSSIISISIIFHMFLVTLDYPVEMMDFFGIIFPLISFDAIPVDALFERMFKFSEVTTDAALSDQFDSAGYSSYFIVQNIGSLFFISMSQIAFSALLWITNRFKPFKSWDWLQSRLDGMANETLWNGMIQFYANNYLLLSVVSLIESNSLRFGTEYFSTEKFCSLLAILGMIMSLGFPLFILILYLRKLRWVDPEKDRVKKVQFLQSQHNNKQSKHANPSHLKKEYLTILLLQTKQHREFLQTYGSLIQGLRIQRLGPSLTVMTPLIDFVLYLLIAIGITRLIHWPVFTIFLFNFAVLFYTWFMLYFQPFDGKLKRI